MASVNPLIRALEGYRPSLEGLRKIAVAAEETGSSELRQASLTLQKFIKSASTVNAQRFAAKAPAVYPSRGEVVAHLLTTLLASPNLGIRNLAADLAAQWFKGIVARGDIGIYGKYT